MFEIIDHPTTAGMYDLRRVTDGHRNGRPLTLAEAQAGLAQLNAPRPAARTFECYSCGRPTRSRDRYCGC